MSSIKKNYIYNAIYQILLIILPLITAPYVTRTIGANNLGIYSYTFSIAQYFSLFITLGVGNYGNRSIAQSRNNKEKMSKTFWEIFSIQFFLGVIISIIYIIYCYVFSNNILISTIQLIYIISVIFDISWLFFGLEEFKITVTRNVIIKLLSFMAIILLIKDTNDLPLYTFILTFSTFINQLILWTFIRKKIIFIKPKLIEIKKHIKPNLMLFIPVLATNIYVLTDKIMLGNLNNMNQVGLYEYADKIRNIPMGIITALGVVMLPKISNLIQNGQSKEARKYIEKSFVFSMFCAFALSFGLASISETFIPLFLGIEFTESTNILKILTIAIIFTAWANVVRTQILIPNSRDKVYLTSTIIGAILNVILNILLINHLLAIGAAIATVISEGAVSIYQTAKSKEYINFKIIIPYIFIFMFSGFIMYICVYFIDFSINNKIILCILKTMIGALVYIFINFIVLFIKKDKILFELFYLNRKERKYEKIN